VFYMTFVAESVFRACGDSRTPMKVLFAGTILNIVLDPFLIFGIGPFPRLEVRGAAIATVVSEVLVLAVYGVLHARGAFPLEIRLSARHAPFSGRRAAQILRVGTPPALIGVLFSVVYLCLARFTGEFGAPALAALGVVNRLESVNYLTAVAMGMGVSAMVGQNLGAGLADRAEAVAHRGAALMTLTTGLTTAVFLAVPEKIVLLFTSDPSAVAESARFLRIVAVSQVFMAWELVYGHAFTGAGDTMPPMYVSAVTSIVRIPLAWWLAFSLGAGPAGIWWTISVTGIVRGAVLPAWFRRGLWKRVDLAGQRSPTRSRISRNSE
jgi:putative MATE family efflux protein